MGLVSIGQHFYAHMRALQSQRRGNRQVRQRRAWGLESLAGRQTSLTRSDACKPCVEALEDRRLLSGLANTPWPMYGMNAQHTGDSPYVGPQTGAVAFMVEGSIIGQNGLIGPGGSMSFDGARQSQNPNQGYFPAVADDGTIYTASDSGLLYAVNPTQP